MEALLSSADQVRSVSPVQMQNTLTSQIDQANQNPTAKNIGQLNATVQMANDQAKTSVNQEDVAKRLMAKGFNPKKAANMAEVIAARLNGQKLTKIQTDRLRVATDNAVVRDVMHDITKKKTSRIDSTQNNVYDEINKIGGMINGGEATLIHSGKCICSRRSNAFRCP